MAALGGSIARRYAKALFAIAVDQNKFEIFGRQLSELAALWTEMPELRQSMENPIFQIDQKRSVLLGVLPRVAPAKPVQNLSLLLLERGRIAFLPAIARAFEEMTDHRLGRVRALVKSAKALDMGSEYDIKKALERRTGKKVIMTMVVDPSLIGGVIAYVAGMVLDGSVATRLANLKTKILN